MPGSKQEFSDKAYEELCKAHDGISDFRAKLLALLPIASGGGILFLLSDKLTDESKTHLLPIGIFGALITAGLFIYELRGIHKCNAFISLGARFEAACGGRFTAESAAPAVLNKFIGATWAALIIYPAVIGAWSYVACVGAAMMRPSAVTVSLLSTLLLMATGKIITAIQEKALKKPKCL